MLNSGGTYGSLCLCVQSRKMCKVLFICKSLRNEFTDFVLILHKDVGVGLPIKVYEYNTTIWRVSSSKMVDEKYIPISHLLPKL